MEAKLEAFDRARIEATRLSAARVAWHLERLWSLPLEERKKTVGLPKNRADLILMGVAIYQAVMEEFGFRELRISTRGLRFAAVIGGGIRNLSSEAPTASGAALRRAPAPDLPQGFNSSQAQSS
jgi:exopolyphosphatase/guanosine-5'-triphosphate,3'-diphosphate pyrophosphatase